MAATGFAVIGAALTWAPSQAAAQKTHDITVTVTRFKALDRADELSRGDFFARITVDGKAQSTSVISDKEEVHPKDWILTATVPAGVHKVKFELIDKDLSVDDPIDINRLPNKRDLDFTVDTRSCIIEGFAQNYKCGATITRGGSENKKADISFKVTVK
ncbi:MAG: hypothetical protein K2Y42_02595 [Hyphomicrobium sp.]|jgi:hypothetical protein|uniref:hypothetical protein n=1 Tax=Hyphomicrobium sp. TaxID=82 RepID=UPI0025B85DFB|nr:hypothetical protein [Hyphomicrobium sp.]MBX9861619.1 hypothetical protein [Hyphomicrobium sp.]